MQVVLVITDKGKFKNNTETKLVHQETKTCVTNTAQYIYPCNVANYANCLVSAAYNFSPRQMV